MVVAVALGLLGPGALLEEEEESTCATCPESSGQWEPGEAPDAEEFHRVALAWESLTKPAGKLDL